MRCAVSLKRMLILLFAATTALSDAGGALGQVGVLNPNPTMPGDATLGGGGSRGSGGGIGIGRGPTPPGQEGEKNPAETMLRGIDGTNYGRYTGRALYTPGDTSAEQPAPQRSRSPTAAASPSPQPSGTAVSPAGGRPENRWRYRLSQGRWWYRMDGGRWSYFDGRRWVPYQRGPYQRGNVPSARGQRTSRRSQ